jgi:hypothetical protein
MLAFTRPSAALICIVVLGSAFALRVANAQKIPLPKVPDAIQAPSNEEVVLIAHATGSQIYTCQPGADGKFSWTLKAPDAELKDEKGNVIGNHYAGPSWKLKDGSEVTGKASAHVDSEDPNSIPWLLVKAIGNAGDGLLSNVTSIQRINTHGGKPPVEGCDDSHRAAETKSAYTADYYFYTPKREENQARAANPSAQSVIYKNARYGFTFSLPKSWQGYSVVLDRWEDANNSGPHGDQVIQRGPLVILQNPRSTSAHPLQDLAIMVFTHAQWDSLQKGGFVVSAAPIGPSEIGRNRKYVFAEPPRNLNPDARGYEEALKIMQNNPLHAF